MIETSERRITPWVGRILAINAVVLLAQQTIVTSESLAQLLSFEPARALQHPWSFFTYMFIHAGFLHLAGNSLALFVFGPAVERRFGSRLFIAYYLLCGLGAAAFSMVMLAFNRGSGVGPPGEFHGMVGASGAIIGVALAYARLMPDAELMVFPLPMPVRARYMIMLLAAYDVLGLLFLNDHIAHDAHIGGLLTGVAFFLVRSLGRPLDTMPLPTIRHRVPVTTRGGPAGQQPLATHRPDKVPAQPMPEENHGMKEAIELDRVLDKISATGISSLTGDEREFLDAMARRRRDLN